ncbi:PspC domain-containing protein [Corynebacterium freneyi]|uniref:PspC domain-containing protein n=1 Tax=Corynebacterium freneyi TaxID=134034 RepID=UPI00254CC13A|nr:PspC domain-containing protein [Corynebacterium freneyi]MDK8768828.1 PspC domain-containing protein [Corynebacterium freneyi]
MANMGNNEPFNQQKISQSIDRMVGTPVRRSHSNKWVAGVCGGIEEATGFNVTALRVIFAVLGLTVAPLGLLLYLGLWLVVPEA